MSGRRVDGNKGGGGGYGREGEPGYGVAQTDLCVALDSDCPAVMYYNVQVSLPLELRCTSNIVHYVRTLTVAALDSDCPAVMYYNVQVSLPRGAAK